VHTSEHTWNFDDLLVACPEINFVDCHHGHVFVIDRQQVHSNRFPDTELNEVEIKLHRAGNFTPAQTDISFALPAQNNGTHFHFAGFMWDKSQPWWLSQCHFHLDCQHFSLQNWQALSAAISGNKQSSSWSNLVFNPFINAMQKWGETTDARKMGLVKSGLFDVNVEADGVPSRKLNMNWQGKANQLTYTQPDRTIITLPEISSAAELELTNNRLQAKKLNIRMPDDKLLVNCKANMQRRNDSEAWQTQAEIIALLGDIKQSNPVLNVVSNVLPNNSFVSAITSLHSGKLFIDLKFSRLNQNTTYSLETTAAGCKINDIAPLLLKKHFQPNRLEELCLSKEAKFAGTILIKSDGSLSFKDCNLEDGPLIWNFAGQMNQSGQWTELSLANKDLQLAKLSKVLGENQRLAEHVKGWLGLNPSCQIALAGQAQVAVKLSQAADGQSNKANSFICEAILNNAALDFSKPAVKIDQLSGSYVSGTEALTIKNLQGHTASGTINVDASMPISRSQPLKFHLHANSISCHDLSAILQLFHLDTQCFNHWQLGGKLKEIDLAINGTASKPSLHLTAIPDDLIFALPDSQSIMHANSGKIIYNNDSLLLEKLAVSNQNSSFVISLAIKNLTAGSKLEKLSMSVTSADLSDWQAFLSPASAPPYFKKISSCLSQTYQINNPKGKISGNIEYDRHEQNWHGAMELDNISLHLGQRKLFCHNLKGKFIFAGDDLIVHGITGNINNSSFSVEGRLLNYQNKLAQWRGESNTQIAPADLNDIISLFTPVDRVCPVTIKCKDPIVLKLKSNINQNTLSQSFTLIANPNASLSLLSNNFSFHQPDNIKLVISGAVRKDGQQSVWHNLCFDFAGKSVTLQGNLSNTANFVVQIPEFMQASLLKEAFFSNIIGEAVSGQIKGSVSIKGPINSPQMVGKVDLSDLSCPSFYLTRASGELLLQPTTPSNGQLVLLSSIHLKELNIGPASLSQASGSITYTPSSFTLKDFTAQLASGKLTASGKTDFNKNKVSFDFSVKDANLAQLWPQITNSQINAAGLLDCHFNWDTSGNTITEREENLAGSGTIHIGRGSFNRTGELRARLNQANLVHQGLFGFHVNNLLQSVLPVKTSEFYSVDAAFGLQKQILTIRRLLYDGRDLKFSAAGKANLALHSLELDVAGVMPRVSSSVIHGPLGQLSREITLQKFLDSVTMHKLEKLPSLPLLGGIGGKTDLFTCRIVAPYNQPKLISQSIQKSFQWLNYRQANAPTKYVQ